MGDGAELALQYAINTELDAPFGELSDEGSYIEHAGIAIPIPYPEQSAELRRALRHKQEKDYDF